MQKIKGIQIAAAPEQPGWFQIDFPMGYGFTISEAEILSPDPQAQLLANMRLAFKVGNYGKVQSKEFLNGINSVEGQNGFETSIGKLFVSKIDDAEMPGRLTVGFSSRKGDSTIEIEVSDAELQDEPDEISRCQAVIGNIGSFLKLRGDKAITQAAINAVKAQQFWW